MMLFFNHNHEVFKAMLSLKTALESLSMLVGLFFHNHHFLFVSIHHFIGVYLSGHQVSLHPLNHMQVLTLVHHFEVSFFFYLFVLTPAVRDSCSLAKVGVLDTELFIFLNVELFL